MYHLLLSIDHWVFNVIHQLPHTVVSDTIALTICGGLTLTIVVWLLLSILLFVREEKRDHWFFLPVVAASALSLLVTDIILKNYFARNRPPGATLLTYSFPSGHATFAWALAVVLAAKEPRAKYFFYLLATLISFARIYLGVHYPSDVIAGTLVGVVIGNIALWIEKNVIKYRHAQVHPNKVKRKRTSNQTRR